MPMPALRIGKRCGALAAIVRHGSDVIRRTLQQLNLPIPAQEPCQSIDGRTSGFSAMTAMEGTIPAKARGTPQSWGASTRGTRMTIDTCQSQAASLPI
ncbi:hypothetical protein An01g07560 [Aspergillus niger]|uniref:Uncharacterized protein n=2 Tax=Aspergillus niger TaxID=5061 RepID=A2Q9E2_ASPNC|nr:hypothetical protein An01g07560 [Aspergillus niger]CAK96181.1 hypothetical protein An01g07560 [Aspergillus niger]